MIWFITGASKGMGRELATAALERGDRVAATARDINLLTELSARFGDRVMPLRLDVTDRTAAFEAVGHAYDELGGLDVVVNNGGYGHFGAFEELSEADLRDQLETNLFGAIWITQAALPFLRAQRSGHIIQVCSVGGIRALPNLSACHAAKWALEAICESLAAEVGPLGVTVTILEPGAFATDWSGSSARWSDKMTEYDFVREAMVARRGTQPVGDPKSAARALLALADDENPPLRALFGSTATADPISMIAEVYEQRLQTWLDWEAVAWRANG